MRPNNNGLKRQDGWNLIDDLGHAHHLSYLLIIRELEGEGVDPINSSAVQRRAFQWTADIPMKDRVLRSMNRLVELGLLVREPVDDHPKGCDWRASELGHQIIRWIALDCLDALGALERGDQLADVVQESDR